MRYLADGQPGPARRLLEAVVADAPDFAGAWLDLALATQQTGDIPAALEHLAYLQARFSLPPALARQVERYQAAWQKPAAEPNAPSPWQTRLSLALGATDNINGGLSAEGIRLTLPGGSLLLPIVAGQRPQADRLLQLDAQHWQARPWAAGTLYPLLGLRARMPQRLHAYDQLDLHAGLIYQQPWAWPRPPKQPTSAPRPHIAAAETAPATDSRPLWQTSLLLQQSRLDGQTLLDSARLGLQLHIPQDACRLSAGLELEWRRYPHLPLGGRWLWLDLAARCPLPAQLQLSAGLRAGQEAAATGQPGGNTRQHDLLLQLSRPLPAGRRLELSGQLGRSQDASGYSPLLEHHAARRLLRRQASLALSQPLDATWHARLSLESQRQASNLALFRQTVQQLLLSVSRAW